MNQNEFNEEITNALAALVAKVKALQDQVNRLQLDNNYLTNRVAQLDSFHR